MIRYSFDDLKIGYCDVYRHWHSQSEQYAGADALLTALYQGWLVAEAVLSDFPKEARYISGNRKRVIYRFTLQRGAEAMMMPVIANPYVEWLLANVPLKLTAAASVGATTEIHTYITY